MAENKTYLELWKTNQLEHPLIKSAYVRPVSTFVGQPDSMNDGGAAHSNFIGGLVSNEQYLFTSSEDETISVWGGDELDEVVTLHPETCVNYLALSPCGRYLAAACDDYTAKLYEIPSMKLVHNLSNHDNYVSKVAFSQQGHLVSISKDGKVCVWDYENGRLMHELQGHEEWVYSLSVHPTKPLAITGALNSSLKVWNLESGECVKDLIKGSMLMYVMGMTVGGGNSSGIGNDKATACSAWLPNGRIVTCAHEVVVWDENTWEVLWKGEQQNKEIKAVYYDESRNMIVTASATVDGWNVDTGEKMFSQVGHDGNQIYSCYASNDILYTGDEKGNINAWSLNSLLQGGNKIQHSWSITDIQVDLERNRIISGSYDNSVIFWDGKGKPLKQFSNFSDSTKPLGAIPGKEHLHILTTYGKVVIYDIEKMEEVKVISIDNKLIEFDGAYWIDNERFIGYTLSYRPRIINVETGAITILETFCSFTHHMEMEDGLVAFTSYPTEPLDIKYDDDEVEEGMQLNSINVDAEGTAKKYKNFSPLMIFDTQSLKIKNHFWLKKKLEKSDGTFYPNKLLEYNNGNLIIGYSDSSIKRWNVEKQECNNILDFPGDDYGMGFFRVENTYFIFDGKSDKIFEYHLSEDSLEEWSSVGADKRNLKIAPDNEHVYYRSGENLIVLNLKSRAIVFNETITDYRQLEFVDDKIIMGTEDGKVYVFSN